MKRIINRHGQEITVGDWVEFKCGIEQQGQVTEIGTFKTWRGGRAVGVLLTSDDGFEGDYIGGDAKVIISPDDIF